jgi:hypothetical protein
MLGVILGRRGGAPRAIRWLAMYALARIVLVRRIVRRIEGGVSPPVARPGESVFDTDVEAVAESLRIDGFDATLRLPPEAVAGLACLGDGAATGTPPSWIERPGSAAADRVAEDPALFRVAARYLGTKPTYRGSRVWWTRPDTSADPRETGARFHYDLYDYRAVLFLIYLTDVDADAAPHVCVRASHRLRGWRDQLHPRRHRSDEEIARSYGTERIVAICGPAGTVIAEDPFCFHKVKLPAARPRLAMQILYTGGDFPAPSFSRDERSRRRDTD